MLTSDMTAEHGFFFQGCALVRRNGQEVLRFSGGRAGGETPVSSGTRFQLASVSKQYTAAATLVLAERGGLELSMQLNTIVPEGPSHWDGITVHQLLCHTAGLVHWRDLPDLDLCSTKVSADELLDTFRHAPLVHEPGTRFSYSSPGYVLLAHVVERVSTVPYREFLERELFTPASMPSTRAGNALGTSYAVPHHEGEEVPSFELDVIGMGAGDVWSTVDDQVAWDIAMRDGTVLGDKWSRAMRSMQAPAPDQVEPLEIDGYGYGLNLGRMAGKRLVFHTGDNAGFLALNAWFDGEDSQCVFLTNDTATPFQPIAFELLEMALDE